MEATLIEIPEKRLATIAQENTLGEQTAANLIAAFRSSFAAAEPLCMQAKDIVVTDATQVSEMRRSREVRLKLKAVRVEAEKLRKDLKAESLRTGKAIDGMYNVLAAIIVPVEERLEQQEQFAERAEAERKAKLKAAREELLRPFGVDTNFYALGEMPEATFTQLFDTSRMAYEQRVEAARKAEEDRKTAEAARIAEEKRIREENGRLQREKEEAERAAKAEREKAEAEARREREAREKLEREAAARKAKEEADKAAAEKAARAAALAPDKEKVRGVAAAMRAIQVPHMPNSVQTRRQIVSLIERAATAIDGVASGME